MTLVRVLVVDDSRAIRARMAALLRELPGVEVEEASGADEAVERARSIAAHAVVLDLHMPGKSGLEVIATLKALTPPPMVLVLTSHATAHHKRSCLAQGADAFFDKAAEFALVVETLARPTAPGR
jgi:two-component system response regulator EvgA